MPSLLPAYEYDIFLSYRHPSTLIYQEEHLQRWKLRWTGNN